MKNNAVEELYKWFRIMTILSIIFAFITLTLFFESRYKYLTYSYPGAIARFWASFALTIIFGTISVTVKKLHESLLLIINRESANIMLVENESEDSIAQQKCPNCGSQHDIDYLKCPFCKYCYDSRNNT